MTRSYESSFAIAGIDIEKSMVTASRRETNLFI
jgi:hypothetical protein